MLRAAPGVIAGRHIKELVHNYLCKRGLNSRPCVHLARRGNLDCTSRTLSTTALSREEKSHLASLRQRGLYNESLYNHVKSCDVTKLDITSQGKQLEITWDDGHISKFHAAWLRHMCQCPECCLDHNGMVTVNFEKIDVKQLKLASATMEGDSIVVLKWEDNGKQTSHEGPIPAAFLRQNCYSEEADQARRASRRMRFSQDKTIPEVEYSEVAKSDYGLYKWLNHLSEKGICLLKNVPTEPGMVAEAAKLIAPVQHTVYGEVFDVISTPQPINAAFSPCRLDLHMDQPHYESPPGLQLLHCIEFDPNIIGGDNTFADIHEIAHKLREERPDYFDTLARVPLTIQTVHYDREYPVHLKIQRPMISLNHKNELVAVVWHPMLTGPLSVASEDVEPFYEAFQHFFTMVNNYESIYKLRMVAGDMISVNNRRVLHGRAGYSNQKGRRFLQGTYVEISEFQSRVQVLHNKLGDGRLATRCGSFDWQ